MVAKLKLWLSRYIFSDYAYVTHERDVAQQELAELKEKYREQQEHAQVLIKQRMEDERELLRLQDRLEMIEEERQRSWRIAEKALEGERISYQSQINRDWQTKGFGTPYPDAPHIPPTAEPQEPTHQQYGRPRMFPGDIVRKRTEQFVQELQERVSKQVNG